MQAFHRHIPILMRALGSSYSDMLYIVSDPPQGCENLLTQVVYFLETISYRLLDISDLTVGKLGISAFLVNFLAPDSQAMLILVLLFLLGATYFVRGVYAFG